MFLKNMPEIWARYRVHPRTEQRKFSLFRLAKNVGRKNEKRIISVSRSTTHIDEYCNMHDFDGLLGVPFFIW